VDRKGSFSLLTNTPFAVGGAGAGPFAAVFGDTPRLKGLLEERLMFRLLFGAGTGRRSTSTMDVSVM